jgi:hypothetical protein
MRWLNKAVSVIKLLFTRPLDLFIKEPVVDEQVIDLVDVVADVPRVRSLAVAGYGSSVSSSFGESSLYAATCSLNYIYVPGIAIK